MEAQGTLLHIGEDKQHSQTFNSRKFVLAIQDGNYTQEVEFELHGQNTDIIDSYGVGEEVKITFNLRGKKFEKAGQEDRWYNTLIAWKISRVE